MRYVTFFTLFSLVIISYSFAGIIYIPNDTTSIQGGIHLASHGDTVLVDDRLYYENINFKGKAITVASRFLVDGDTSHISNTIIDGSQPSHPDTGSVVRFVSGEDTTSIICGFTITGGTGTITFNGEYREAGGIYLYNSGGKIMHNKIVNNNVQYSLGVVGGGISAWCENATGKNIIIKNNEVTQNSITGTFSGGGGVSLGGYVWINYWVDNNLITKNIVTNTSLWKAMGGGLIHDFKLPTIGTMIIRNNIISKNETIGPGWSFGAGIYIVDWEDDPSVIDTVPNPLIYNNLIIDNYSGGRAGGIAIWRAKWGTWVPSPGQGIVAQPIIVNNTIVKNRSSYKPGCGLFIMNAIPVFKNNILWNTLYPGWSEISLDSITSPGGNQWNNDYGDIIMSYSNIRDTVWQGIGNISSDPMVFDSLMAPNDTMFCCLSPISPCIDAGDPDPDYNDFEDSMNPGYGLFPAMGTIRNDMGAYGGHGKFGNIVVGIEHEPKRQVVSSYSMYQNYPNPFNPTTTILFDLPKTSQVTLKIFNILGEEVATLVSDKLSTGLYSYEWDASDLASGVYLYRLQAGNYVETRKMVLMR